MLRRSTVVGSIVFVVLLAGCGGGGVSGGAGSFRYSQIAVPMAPGPSQPTGAGIVGINNAGTVVGYAQANGPSGLVPPVTTVFTVSTATHAVTTINTGQLNIVPEGINDSGQILCNSANSYVAGYPFAFQPPSTYVISDGRVTQLQVPSGYSGCSGIAINNEGQIIGNLYTAASISEPAAAYIHEGLGPITTKDILQAHSGSGIVWLTGINNWGEVAGTTGGIDSDAFLYANGTITAFAAPAGYHGVRSTVINDNGQVACIAFTYSSPIIGGPTFYLTHPYLLVNGRYKDLGNPPGTNLPIYRVAMNDRGEVLLSSGELYSGGGWHSLDDPATVSGLPAGGISFAAVDQPGIAINNEGTVARLISPGNGKPVSIGVFSPG